VRSLLLGGPSGAASSGADSGGQSNESDAKSNGGAGLREGVLMVAHRAVPSAAQRHSGTAPRSGPSHHDAYDHASAKASALRACGGSSGASTSSIPGAGDGDDGDEGGDEDSDGPLEAGRVQGGDFGAGATWEPAAWLRAWAAAGIRRLHDPPPRQYHACCAVSKRHMLLCGGELSGPVDNVETYRVAQDVFLLDLKSSEWAQLPVANPMRRAGHAMVVLDGRVFCFGGRSGPLPVTKPFPADLYTLHYDG
jgi:hypothetical protein